MLGPKQRRKVTGDEEEAFPRHTQVSAKEESCRRRPSEVERRPTEAWNAKKMEKQGLKRTNGGLEVQDGAGQAYWKKLGTEKWATRPHAPARGIQAAGEKWRVGGFLAPVLWEKLQISSLRSWWCGRCWKISLEKKSPKKCWQWWGFLIMIWLTGKLWEMEKVTRMKHGHWTDSQN